MGNIFCQANIVTVLIYSALTAALSFSKFFTILQQIVKPATATLLFVAMMMMMISFLSKAKQQGVKVSRRITNAQRK